MVLGSHCYWRYKAWPPQEDLHGDQQLEYPRVVAGLHSSNSMLYFHINSFKHLPACVIEVQGCDTPNENFSS